MAWFTTVAGAAAVERTTLISALRREALLWTLTAVGDGMIELAQDLTGRQVRSHRVTIDDAGQRSGGLWDLLPLPADLRRDDGHPRGMARETVGMRHMSAPFCRSSPPSAVWLLSVQSKQAGRGM
jgi:hypothetical protein